jgi:D-amino-acid dehydrogenase
MQAPDVRPYPNCPESGIFGTMDKTKRIAVIGGGIVGITAALELQRRGYRVTLIDRRQPGRETSYGNTGVLSDASIVISNNPGLLQRLPRFILKKSNALNYSLGFVLSRLPWVVRFLTHCSETHMNYAADALRAIQVLSLGIHHRLIEEAGAGHLLRRTGWLKLFRSEAGYQAYARERGLLERTGVRQTFYNTDDLSQLEPALKKSCYGGILLDDCCSVSSPAALCDAYLGLFTAAGGTVRQGAVNGLSQGKKGTWRVTFAEGMSMETDKVLIAAGPWSSEIAGWLGYRIPMAWERGYHLHLHPGPGPALNRAIHDVERGYVMTPQLQGARVTSGVELTYRDAPKNDRQIRGAVASARELADFGEPVEDEPWMGRRPTLVDSLPMIGAAPRHDGLWFDFGHQHTGLGMSTGSARILADLFEGKTPPINAAPFRPDRFPL